MPDLATMESLAVDLSSPRSIDRAKKRRGRKQAISRSTQQRINTEIGRAEKRIDWLDREAARLPMVSNAHRKAIGEAVVLRALVNDLQKPPRSRPNDTHYSGLGFKHAQRAAALLNEIVPEEKGKVLKPKPAAKSTAARPAEPRAWHGPRLGKPTARKAARRAAAKARATNR